MSHYTIQPSCSGVAVSQFVRRLSTSDFEDPVVFKLEMGTNMDYATVNPQLAGHYFNQSGDSSLDIKWYLEGQCKKHLEIEAW